MSELDTLLDATLDDLADLPEFKPFGAGTHRVLASLTTDKIGDKPVIKLGFTYVECIEMADAQEEEPKPGDTCDTMFMIDNEYGLGNFKKCAAPFGEALGTNSLRDIVEQTKDIDCAIVTSIRLDKKDPDKKYLNVKQIAVG